MAFEDLRIEMKCKDFRIEVEEGLKGDSLSIVAQDHAAGCRPCREFNQKHIEFREWLAVCRQVTAPKDFQFGVQRKIAGAETLHAHGWAWSRMRYIVPSAALMAVAVLIGFYFFVNTGAVTNSNPGVATLDKNINNAAKAPAAAVNNAPLIENIPVKPETVKPGEDVAAANAAKPESVRPDPKGGTLDSEAPRRNIDSAVKEPEKPKTPDGINLNDRSSSADRSKTLIAMQSLGAITGVADMKVKEVKTNSPAERSGIKAGDVVESINGKFVTVKRGLQTLQITVQ